MKKIILVFLLFGCSQQERIFKIEDNLQSYVDNFFAISGQYGYVFQRDNLIIKTTHDLVDIKGGWGATTLNYRNGKLGQRIIEFDYDFWMKATESQRETLSLHEFGHAYLNRQHTTGYSLMNVSISPVGWPKCSGGECKHEFLLEELFRDRGQ